MLSYFFKKSMCCLSLLPQFHDLRKLNKNTYFGSVFLKLHTWDIFNIYKNSIGHVLTYFLIHMFLYSTKNLNHTIKQAYFSPLSTPASPEGVRCSPCHFMVCEFQASHLPASHYLVLLIISFRVEMRQVMLCYLLPSLLILCLLLLSHD